MTAAQAKNMAAAHTAVKHPSRQHRPSTRRSRASARDAQQDGGDEQDAREHVGSCDVTPSRKPELCLRLRLIVVTNANRPK